MKVLSSTSYQSVSRLYATLTSICLLAILLPGRGVNAQTLPDPRPTSPAENANAGRNTNPDDGNPFASVSRVSLSANQIITLLQDRPQITIELKSLLAETQQQQQGPQVQPDDITDEMLYSQINSSKELRENITVFLRARGYISDADLQREMMDARDDAAQSYASQSQTLSPGTGRSTGLTTQSPQSGTALQSDLTPNDGSPAGSDRLSASEMGTRTNQQERVKTERNITEEPQVLRQPAPYNLMSLRDLYTQIPDSPEKLKRFGSDVFLNRNAAGMGRSIGSAREMALDVPVGPDYVVGPGDGVTVSMWGGVSQSFARVIAVDGHISLPEAGDVQVAGLTLERVQTVIQSALKRQYRDVQVSVALSRLRTIRIYVVGDVQRPGAYDVSSLSSPLNVLYAAGGPTAVGSLRTLEHYRGKQLIGKVDLYDFLLHGIRDGEDRLQGGDTLIIPASGPQVAVWGAVRRPAIYELKGETTLAGLLDDAGGMTVAASLGHIAVERIDANQHRETITFDLPSTGDADKARAALATFNVKDGDRIHIAPIAPYSERVIYLEGHVVRPGRHPYREGMHLSDVLKSYQDLLPEPAAQGEIVRLVPPDLHAQTIEFDVPEALIGNSNLSLQPFDTIRIMGRYEVDAPKVDVRGEVLRPGSYPLSEGMTAPQLVRMAGGFKRDALLDRADLMSYRVINGTKVESQRTDVRIGDAVEGRQHGRSELKAGDVLTIHQITGWNDIGASITVEGEVAHPGSYGFQDGEHLSDVLRRRAGFGRPLIRLVRF